jgi:putative ABC transport system permease protein
MRALFYLAFQSLWNRRFGVVLTVFTLALSTALLIGVERLRGQARVNFEQTLSGTDLIVGARSGPIQLLLYSVFHMGQATHEFSMASLNAIAAHPQVAWHVPLALGDSHRGYRVMGTTPDYFVHYKYGEKKSLQFQEGHPFSGLFEAVIGAQVAAKLGYTLGQSITLTHGTGPAAFADHEDKPFRITGVLAPTGTPADRSIWVSLESIEAIHLDWHAGMPIPGLRIGAEHVTRFDLQPKKITAALVGLHQRTAVFQVQRHIHQYPDEALSAILPGATLHELWAVVAVVENTLLAVSALVVIVGLSGLVAIMMTSLTARRRELAILRALGAGPVTVFGLLVLESLLLTLLSVFLGLGLLWGAGLLASPFLLSEYGLVLQWGWPSLSELRLLLAMLGCAVLASFLPGLQAYRYSVTDGMRVRL